jgi:hypothetical protein
MTAEISKSCISRVTRQYIQKYRTPHFSNNESGI